MRKTWKVAFCGLGSIGSRHLRDLQTVFSRREDDYTVDLIRADKSRPVPEEFRGVIREVFSYEDQIDSDYDIIFVTNPTAEHYQTISRYHTHTRSMFIEKPIYESDVHGIDHLKDSDCICYVACPIRYKQLIQYLRTNVPKESVLAARAVCSSYLPEWHKGVDYRKLYAAKKSMGGGVSLDLIHEIDYLTYLFGMPEEIHNIQAHVSPLEIDSDDVSVYIARLKNMVFQVYLDYFGRKDIRTLTLFTTEDTIQADLLANTITFHNPPRTISFEEVRDDYQIAEIEQFLRIVEQGEENENDLQHAYAMLKLTLGKTE